MVNITCVTLAQLVGAVDESTSSIKLTVWIGLLVLGINMLTTTVLTAGTSVDKITASIEAQFRLFESSRRAERATEALNVADLRLKESELCLIEAQQRSKELDLRINNKIDQERLAQERSCAGHGPGSRPSDAVIQVDQEVKRPEASAALPNRISIVV